MSPVRIFHVLAASLLVVGAASCKDDHIVTVTPHPLDTMYWALHNDIHAATVAIGGQQQLTATPVTVDGTPITDLPMPTFTSADTTKVQVDSTGLVTGVAETQGVAVVASLTADDVTYLDTTIVAVTPGTAVFTGLSLEVPGGMVLGLGDPGFSLDPHALDDHDQAIPGAVVSVVSLNSNRLALYSFGGPPYAQTAGLGKVLVVMSATCYGVTKVDTVEFTVQYGTSGFVSAFASYPSVDIGFSPTSVLIGVGGSVSFTNSSFTNAIDIIFDPDQLPSIEGGNIMGLQPFFPDNKATRRFLAVGTYQYKNPVGGLTGKIIVREQPTF